MGLEIAGNKTKLCATCMYWGTNIRKMMPDRQNIIYEANNKAYCEAPDEGEFVGQSTNSTHKCRVWRACRKMRPVPTQFAEAFKTFGIKIQEEKERQMSSVKKPTKEEIAAEAAAKAQAEAAAVAAERAVAAPAAEPVVPAAPVFAPPIKK